MSSLRDLSRYAVRALRGTVGVAGLALCLVTLGDAAQPAQPLSLVPPSGHAVFARTFFGLHVHRDADTDPWPDIDIGALRLWDAYVSWVHLEPRRGQWRFDRLDQYVQWAQAHNVDLLLPLGLTPTWASARPLEKSAYGRGMAAEPNDMDDWRTYVRTVAQRYKGKIQAYEIWNEVTATDFYSGTPEVLAKLTQIAREELQRADPKALLVAPSGVGLDWRVEWPSKFLVRGTRTAVDVASFHLYHAGPPEGIVAPAQRMRQLMDGQGFSSIPLWNTESGYALANDKVQWSAADLPTVLPLDIAAQYLPRYLILARALGFERFYWYDWDGARMGLLDPLTRTHRQIAEVYQQMIHWLRDSDLRRCDLSASGVWQCALVLGDGRPAALYWLDPSVTSPPPTVALDQTDQIIAFDGKNSTPTMSDHLTPSPTVVLTIASGTQAGAPAP